jgi:PAS domain S-box-containing protein
VLTTNALDDPRFGNQESIIVYNLRSILCVPLKVKGEITGVIYADNRIRVGLFTDNERDLLVAFSHQAAEAIENARLFESIKHTLGEVTELKNLMDNIFASMASGVITTNNENKILLCNRAAEEILGRRKVELIGRSLDEIFQPISSEIRIYVQEAREKGQYFVGKEFKLEIPLRGMVTLSINLSPLKDAMQVTQGVAIVLDDLTEQKRLEGQHKLFERMVSPKVIHQLDPDKIQLGGNRMKITTLFADIRGFTNYSESHDPEHLVRILNRYLAIAAEEILAQEGTIDKFMGDAVMAWFNAPISQPDHIIRSIKTALNIQQAVDSLHKDLPSHYHMHFGIGIHFGDAVLGLIGSERQVEYTAIGDSVNTAKRIQENALGGQILVSEAVFKKVHLVIRARKAESITAKGKRDPVEVYEVLGLR